MTAVRILRLAAGGDGVGKLPDGRTVFVPRSAPGDLVEFAAAVQLRRDTLDRLPQFGYVTLQVPSPDFGRENWSV